MGFTDLLAQADRIALDVLGGPVVFTPGVGSPVTVQGIFDASYRKLDLGQPGVSTAGPAVFLELADLPSNPVTDLSATVTISGTTYTIHEVQPDGLGGVVLLLHGG